MRTLNACFKSSGNHDWIKTNKTPSADARNHLQKSPILKIEYLVSIILFNLKVLLPGGFFDPYDLVYFQ